jgi:hypothetical protein
MGSELRVTTANGIPEFSLTGSNQAFTTLLSCVLQISGVVSPPSGVRAVGKWPAGATAKSLTHAVRTNCRRQLALGAQLQRPFFGLLKLGRWSNPLPTSVA